MNFSSGEVKSGSVGDSLIRLFVLCRDFLELDLESLLSARALAYRSSLFLRAFSIIRSIRLSILRTTNSVNPPCK